MTSHSDDTQAEGSYGEGGRATGPASGSPDRPSTVLTRSPSLLPVLAAGALRSPFKRPSATADFPRTRLVLPGLRIDLARLAAYERVCGFPTGEDALPVTYPQVLGFPVAMSLLSRRDFPLPLLGLVHTSIEITRYRALTASGEYELTVYIDGLVPHRRGTEVAVVTELRVGADVVWESVSTYLARHRTEDTGGEREQEKHGPLPGVAEWRLAGDIGRRYAAASGDRNPIHLYPLTARLFGFPRAIAHGMWTAARCLAAHGTPQAVLVRAEFRAPVLLPGTVTYAADGERFELCGGDRVHVSGGVHPLTGHTPAGAVS
ncbi:MULTISPECIES: MaoC family dehydratase [Streptomyces]|uniref:Dehydratase n=1 Tax=Streptomyces pseudovenezuelae TaxID=67350 RepID=A0A101N9R2_9ACTN|nr:MULTISPECIES: MaoC/PaaZ C-terminal domain-containing protein [Streptomyces]KUM89190.1 dehydratase [Streptomyces pseudovenezuelae]